MLKELIDQFYLDNQKNREQTRFYITDAGKCPRAVFFKFKNAVKAPMDARILRIFEHGENIHRSIFNVLYRLRIGVVTEIAIPQQEIISGRADAILCMGNENYVLDIKSMNSMIFRKLVEPKEENVYQMRSEYVWNMTIKAILSKTQISSIKIVEFARQYDLEYDQRIKNSLK